MAPGSEPTGLVPRAFAGSQSCLTFALCRMLAAGSTGGQRPHFVGQGIFALDGATDGGAMIQRLTKSVTDHPAVKHLGPGLITGAADDDPSGIATYSQAG